jgi:hypothetical protein
MKHRFFLKNNGRDYTIFTCENPNPPDKVPDKVGTPFETMTNRYYEIGMLLGVKPGDLPKSGEMCEVLVNVQIRMMPTRFIDLGGSPTKKVRKMNQTPKSKNDLR